MFRKTLQSIVVAAIAALALQLAPSAVAGSGGHHGEHYDDPEAQMWYEFAEEKAQEINLLRISHCAWVSNRAVADGRRIRSYCLACEERVDCRADDCCPFAQRGQRDRLERKRRSLSRKSKKKISKKVWEAKMELETCYEDARQQLEDAGYDRFVPYIYRPYNQTRQEIVRKQRRANHFLMCAANCRLDNVEP